MKEDVRHQSAISPGLTARNASVPMSAIQTTGTNHSGLWARMTQQVSKRGPRKGINNGEAYFLCRN